MTRIPSFLTAGYEEWHGCMLSGGREPIDSKRGEREGKKKCIGACICPKSCRDSYWNEKTGGLPQDGNRRDFDRRSHKSRVGKTSDKSPYALISTYIRFLAGMEKRFRHYSADKWEPDFSNFT